MRNTSKNKIKLNDISSLQSVLQEAYSNACSQIKDAQKVINDIANNTTPLDVDDYAKLAKAKTDALKLKENAIKLKIEVGKQQADLLKNSNAKVAPVHSGGTATMDDYSAIHDLINKKKTEDKE